MTMPIPLLSRLADPRLIDPRLVLVLAIAAAITVAAIALLSVLVPAPQLIAPTRWLEAFRALA